jgi:hypothetical protein
MRQERTVTLAIPVSEQACRQSGLNADPARLLTASFASPAQKAEARDVG